MIEIRIPSGARPVTFGIDVQANGLQLHLPAGSEALVRGGDALLRAPSDYRYRSDCRVDRASAAPARFIKIDAAGAEQPADAKHWAGVLDTVHGLLWSAGDVVDERLDHDDATEACAKICLCGYEDWRLPTRAELLTLVDDTRHEPAIDTAFFPTCRSNWYWTSTPAAWSPASCAPCGRSRRPVSNRPL
jgi:hypothetical protein